MRILAIKPFQKANSTHKNLQSTKNYNSTTNQINELPKSYYQPLNLSNPYPQAISFQGINAKGLVKQRGIFMHITSLPATRSFCGQFGDEQTSKFINWLANAKQTHWIMNPLNALEDHLCPYSAAGRYSRNKFIVNLNKLTSEEYGKILKENGHRTILY